MPCADFILGMYPLAAINTTDVGHSFFYKHELLAKYEWYWRLEPEIKYFCDIT